MHTDKTKTEQNFMKFNTSRQKFMRKYAHLSSREIDQIGHTSMNHPVLAIMFCTLTVKACAIVRKVSVLTRRT